MTTQPLIGLHVRIERDGISACTCSATTAVIGAGKGPHAGELVCSVCSKHRGWLSKASAAWIFTVINKFGAPTTPIIVRRSVPHHSAGESPAPPAQTTKEQAT